jgi:2-polyprenyl-6-hydroxyphenyl methylase/3-demethylubiquinone-9 3-methyltransferase
MNVAALERGVAARFDAVESRFRAAVGADDVRLGGLRAALGPVAGTMVLDVGCGKGRFARHLASDGARVVGMDISAAMLAGAGGIDRVRASSRFLPFADGSFDAVIAVEVLEHVPDVAGVLGSLARVCRPGGVVAVIDKNVRALDAVRPWVPAAVIKRRDERLGRWMYPPGGPLRERWFGARGLSALMWQAGLESVRVTYLIRPEEARWMVFRRIPMARLWTMWTARRPGDGRPCA